MLTVCLPGTGGFMPLPNRWLTCCWVEYQGKALLIDCGEGTQLALRQAGLHLSRLELLLLTHFHADHVAGLPGLLLTAGNLGKTTPLTIAGPPGLRYVVAALLVVAPVAFPIRLVELEEGETLPGWEGLGVSFLPLRHSVPCYGYRVAVERKPVFNPQKAQALGVPKPLYRQLHSGAPVTLEGGRVVTPDQVLEGARPPITVTYCTDTRPFAAMAEFSRGADLMIAEGMYGEDALAAKAAEKQHSIFSDSARLAAAAGAKRLWLTHFSPALSDPQAYIAAAQALFPGAQAGCDGLCIRLGSKVAPRP